MLKHLLFFTVAVFATSWIAQASDPDILSDFIFPADSNAINGSFFTFTGMRGVLDSSVPPNFKVTKASMAEFPALNGQSVSFAVLQYPAESVNPLHTHPRSAEHLLSWKGLVHFQYNANAQEPAVAISAFGSANAGTVSVPLSVFATGIDDGILAKSFKTDVATIQKIKAGLGGKA
ncbi:Germin-like protein 9-3 [Vitis vinifera]|uniref:Germin-like protein 9-3 n=1 Tax=Vitis vinifera TaxID=29760 RepID=A0A438HQI2_VITVI|nr:Germin-like protein 9-3 [Vitis vinifera]